MGRSVARWVWLVQMLRGLISKDVCDARSVAGWVWLVQASALLSALVLGIMVLAPVIKTHWEALGFTVFLALLVPYLLILFLARQSGKPLTKALSLALVTEEAGILGLLFPLLHALLWGLPVGACLLLMALQVALVLGTKAAHLAIQKQTGDRPAERGGLTLLGDRLRLGEGVVLTLLGAAVFFGTLFVSFLYTEPIRTRVDANEASTTSALRTVNTAEVTYDNTYNAGYTPTLAELGSPAADAKPDASHADLVDPVLSGTSGGTATSFHKSGYRFVYTPGAADVDGRIRTYTITARPIEYKQSGLRSFFTDQTCVIRQTSEDRPATAKDPPL